MKNLLIIGCGDIGLRAAAMLRHRYRIFALSHSPVRFEALREAGVLPIPGDLDDPESLLRIAGTAQTVFHLAPPSSSGEVDARTRNLLAALSAKCSILPHRLIYISTSGVYGNCDGEWVPETRPAKPETQRAVRRLDAENRIRKWGRENRVSVSILRVPGIFSRERISVERLKMPVLSPEDDVYTNHIHAEDLARALVLSMRHGAPGRTYNVCDDSGLKMGEYFELVASRLGMDSPARMRREELRGRISPMMYSFLCESRRLVNDRMKSELGLALRYPRVADAL
ncbi:MAG: SDR family oxidoreductase [Burkholderiales bacterium]|nr:SDR family oxidoreductase [Burkholderiales bacterium]